MLHYTSIRICDLKDIIDQMNPVKIFINNKCVWDDDDDSLEDYNLIFERTTLVSNFEFKIVHYHHSYCFIQTVSK